MSSSVDENVVDFFRISRVIDHLFDMVKMAPDFFRILMGLPLDAYITLQAVPHKQCHCLWSPIVGVGVAFCTLACRNIFLQTTYFLVLFTHQGDKLLVRSVEFDEQRLEVGRLLE